ncbi:hypothetical protein JR316_0012786 [Psilocybe cubensis]|uniref:Uncharacterized protein n=2 Tax=Psilocybe cubensis TaxID=181762 RepID=A0ACB8GFL0_PSICU|nr:hypothetical protein JR316_0012786 [Psilocybe cubensis]KAH9474328.1 hypothetical protein JR316_0012786 [Psilocybe cubensis]
MRKHRILSEEWDETVEKIRKIDGSENFLQAPQFKQLQAAAVEGPVIIVNISSYRCDAIIILHHSPPVLVPLPQARSETLLDHATKLQSSREIVGVLRDIWRTIGHPVVERLSDIGIAQKSRIWWCPTSALCALPLHAAGPYRRGERNLPDIYISSYTPTLSALIRARSKISKSQGVLKLLVVGQSGKDLHRVKNEVDVIRRYEDSVDVLMDSEATRNAVLSGIMDHSRVHLACHGHLGDDNQPFRSSFELYNERLELLELIQANYLMPSSHFFQRATVQLEMLEHQMKAFTYPRHCNFVDSEVLWEHCGKCMMKMDPPLRSISMTTYFLMDQLPILRNPLRH